MLSFLENSALIKFLRILRERYSYLRRWRQDLRQDSCSCQLVYCFVSGFWYEIKLCFKYSFLGRISEINEDDHMAILEESKAMSFFIRLSKKWQYRIISYLRLSKTDILMDEFRKEFISLPVKSISLIIVTTVLTNTIVSILTKQRIEFLGYLMRGLFLFAGFAGINSKIGWPVFKNGSLVLKLFSKKCAGSAER